MSVNVTSRIVIDDARVMHQIVVSLTDYSRDYIYKCNMFIEQATDNLRNISARCRSSRKPFITKKCQNKERKNK